MHDFRNFAPLAKGYLDQYTDPAKPYAFATYDQAPVHDGHVTASDILMVNLLSLRFTWREVLPLFTTADDQYAELRRELDAALDEARLLPALECCSPEEAQMPALKRVNEFAGTLTPLAEGKNLWGVVAVSKVLHRLSPNVPLVDSRVRTFYGTAFAGVVRSRMRQDLIENREWMQELAPRYPVRGRPMPLARMADILIWMSAG